MRHETRTKKQIEADKLDLDVFRVVTALDRFAVQYRHNDVGDMAAALDGMRHRVRRHMHKNDADATRGA